MSNEKKFSDFNSNDVSEYKIMIDKNGAFVPMIYLKDGSIYVATDTDVENFYLKQKGAGFLSKASKKISIPTEFSII